MGTWGHNSFENDDALDWVSNELAGANDLSAISSALASVAEWQANKYLEWPECAAAIAAAEVVAALHGWPSSKMPDSVLDWLAGHKLQVGHEVISTALKAIERVRHQSEMQETWDETADHGLWQQSLSDLEARLRR
jgi:hypothetical protein